MVGLTRVPLLPRGAVCCSYGEVLLVMMEVQEEAEMVLALSVRHSWPMSVFTPDR